MSTETPDTFPIAGGPRIPLSMIAPHERQAWLNHGQTLERLAQRGGLSCCEAVAVLSDRAWTRMEQSEAREQLIALVNKDQSAKVAALERRNSELTARIAELEKKEIPALIRSQAEFTQAVYDGQKKIRETLEQQLAEARKDSAWQPIETAPKDGTRVLVAGCKSAYEGYWCKREEAFRDSDSKELCTSTHWMPLPSIPSSGSEFNARQGVGRANKASFGQWYDILTAPLDETPILIATDAGIHRVQWIDGNWMVDDQKHGPYLLRGYMVATHWMPLPATPLPEKEGTI